MENGSSQEVSPARIFPSLVKALGWTVPEAGFGMNTPALLASYDRDTRSWRTSELSLFEGSIGYLGRLPKSGTMRNGKIFAPPTSERPTEGNESGLLPTPSATEYGSNQGGAAGRMGPVRPSLATMARNGLWPSPKASDGDRGGRGDLLAIVRGKPNKHTGLWPTPTKSSGTGAGEHGTGGPNLQTAVKLWPTPRTAGMCGGTGNWNQLKDKCENIEEARKMGAGNGGQLNPMWVEWLMGYPLGWTDLNV